MTRLAKIHISLALVCLTLGLLVICMACGLMPNSRQQRLHSRARLCEAIAIFLSAHGSSERTAGMRQTLQSLVDRHPEIISAGVRQLDGDLIVDINSHARRWTRGERGDFLDTQLDVPIHSEQRPWATVELFFTPAQHMNWWYRPIPLMFMLVGCGGFIAYAVLLGKMLPPSEDSAALPKLVSSTPDALAEGRLHFDSELRSLVANRFTGNNAPLQVPTPPLPRSFEPLRSTLPMEDEDFQEIVVEWVESLQEQLGKMDDALASQNMKELAGLAHWLKGSGGTVGFPAFTNPAKQLELSAKQNKSEEALKMVAKIRELAQQIDLSPTPQSV